MQNSNPATNITIERDLKLTGKHGRPFLTDIAYSATGSKSPIIIFSHGFKGFKDWGPFNMMALEFAQAGFHFVKFNFAFNGTTLESPCDFIDLDAFGQNNFTHELNDLDVVISWIKNSREIDSDQPIFLLGHSRGGGISILKAHTDSRILAVAGWGSVTSFSKHISISDIRKWKNDGVLYVENARTGQLMPLYVQLYYDFLKNRDLFNIRNAVSAMAKPVLLVHGTDDETIPVSRAREMVQLNTALQLIEVPGSDHAFGASHPMESGTLPPDLKLTIDTTAGFFLKHL